MVLHMNIFKSRKFWTAIIDVAVVLVLYFTGKYMEPTVFEDIKLVIITIQPVFLLVIGGIAYEDAQAKKAGNFPHW